MPSIEVNAPQASETIPIGIPAMKRASPIRSCFVSISSGVPVPFLYPIRTIVNKLIGRVNQSGKEPLGEERKQKIK